MFVQEEAAGRHLLSVKLAKELQMHHGLVPLAGDHCGIAPNCIELPTVAERCAHRAADEEHSLLLCDAPSTFVTPRWDVEGPGHTVFIDSRQW